MASLLVATPTARSAGSSTTRNEALDFTKGSLVLLMVLYHWLNYFVDLDWDVYRYLRFLTPSFIFITGFLVTSVYLTRYSPTDRELHRRLFERGLKLLMLFTFLNLFARVSLVGFSGAPGGVWVDAHAIYVTGNGRAAFDVLVPISYFLLLSPIFLKALSVSRTVLVLIAATALASGVATSIAGVGSTNLELVAMAVLGMTLGTLSLDGITRVAKRMGLLLVLYGLYVVAVTLWNIPFLLQVFGVCLSLLLIYAIGLKATGVDALRNPVVVLGQYSLFTYILHIFLLQLFRRSLDGFPLNSAGLLIPLILTVVVLLLVVQGIARTRVSSRTFDRLYRVVFA